MSSTRDGRRAGAKALGPAVGAGGKYRAVLILTALIVAGALYPFDFSMPYSHEAAWERLLEDWVPEVSITAALGEIALFAIYGFAGIQATPLRLRPAAQVIAAASIALVLAALRQLSQIYVAPWAPALGNVVWNMTGAGLGIAAGLWLRGHSSTHDETWKQASVPAILVSLWLAAEMLPFVPTLNPQWVKDVVMGLLRRPALAPIEVLWHAAGVLVAGRALSEVLGRSRSLALLAMLSGAVALGKVLIVSQVLTASALAGLAAGLLLWLWLSSWRLPWHVDLVLLVVMGAAYTLTQLQPFAWRAAPASFGWVPFTGMDHGTLLTGVQACAGSAFAFAAMLGLMRMRGLRIRTSSLVLASWVVVVAISQIFVAGRSPGLTDPLLVLLAGWILNQAPSRDSQLRPAMARA